MMIDDKKNIEILSRAFQRGVTILSSNPSLTDQQKENVLALIDEANTQLNLYTSSAVDRKKIEVLPTKRDGEATVEKISHKVFSQDLLDVIKKVKMETFKDVFLRPNLEECTKNKQSAQCIGTLVNADLWNGGLIGWPTLDVFLGQFATIWKYYPEIFATFDEDFEILENSPNWDQDYFDKQRNCLRHNFSLERLCHLALVYNYIFKEKISPSSNTQTKASGIGQDLAFFYKKDTRHMLMLILPLLLCFMLGIAIGLFWSDSKPADEYGKSELLNNKKERDDTSEKIQHEDDAD